MAIISAKACLRYTVLLSFSFPLLWAGNEYAAKPGEDVKPGEIIVRLKNGASPASVISSYMPGAQVKALGRLNLYVVKNGSGLSSNTSSNLAKQALVDYVEPNRLRHTMLATPNDPMFSSQWALQAVHALQAWGILPNSYLTAAGAGNGNGRIKVAVLDTGVDCTHPDFMNAGGSSTNAAVGGQLLWSASQALVSTVIQNPTCPWQDDFGHGTHVAGIIAAAASNATGVTGVGYPLEVIAYKVLDNTGSGDDGTIATAIMAAADAGAQVISLSLGGAGYSQTMQAAVNYAWQRNTLVVAAAGNSSSASLFFPADANYAVAVSATDSTNGFASFSNYGPGIKIAAPGVGVLSTTPTYPAAGGFNPNYGTLSGTSMATPHVSAVAGLVGMTTPGTSAGAILQRIQESATSNTVGGGWDQHFGYGILNAYNAVAGVLRSASNGGLVGQIVDTNAQPLSGATVTVSGSSLTTDSSGLYRFSLGAGAYSVSVSATGFPPQTLTANVIPGADTTLTISMGVIYGKFIGTVKDNGLPVAGAIVQGLTSGLILGTAVADINGQYTLWLPAGTYDIRASSIGHNNVTIPSQTVAATGSVTVNLVETTLGNISGVVRDSNQHPLTSVQIAVTGSSSAGAVTDSNGYYTVLGLPTGTYTVTASAAGLATSTANNVSVTPDSTAIANFILSPPVGMQNVTWLAQGNATLSPDATTVQKTSGCDGCADAGGISQQQISSGDGFAEFTFGDTSFKEVGLHPAGTWFQAWNIQFGFNIWSTSVEIRENGVYRANAPSVAGDVFRIQITGGQIAYLKNGVVLYTSTQAISYPLAMQVRFAVVNSSLGNARIFTAGGVGAPSISSSSSMLNGTAGSAYSQALTATGGTTPYSWSLASGSTLPAGLSLSTGGVMSGTPTTAGSYTFTVKVTDNASLSTSKPLSLTIGAALAIGTTSPMLNGIAGSAYSQTLTAVGGTPSYSWSLASGSSLPTGLSLSTGGVLSGTPTTAASYSFTVKVADSASQSATKPFSLTIGASGGGPTVQNVTWLAQGNATLSPDATTVQKAGGCDGCPDAGGISQQQISSGDGFAEFTFGDTSFKEVGLHPAGTWFQAWSVQFGFIIWSTSVEIRENGLYRANAPSVAGDVFRVQITGGQVTYLKNGVVLYTSSQAVSYPLAMQVRFAVLNSSFGNARIFTAGGVGGPSISSSSPMSNGTAGSAYSQLLAATGGSAPYSWSLASGSTLPAGLSLSTGGLLSGTPTTAGSYSFTVKATDNVSLSTSKPLSLTIGAALAISTTSPMLNGTAGSAYSQTLTAVGGTPSYSWSLASGSSLPTGLSLSGGGVLSGTPSTAASYSFTVKVTDSASQSATKPFSLTIGASGGGPTVQNVTWLAQGNATLSPDATTVQKTSGCDGCPDAGGISQQQISSGDGYAEFTFGDTSFKEVGLHSAGTWFQAWSIQFGFNIWSTSVEVRENGVYRANVPSVAGDVFRVQITGGQVTYLKNGVVLYTSSQAVSYPLAMQVRFAYLNSSFGNARILP